jgi:CheY-like chemotaxis protein
VLLVEDEEGVRQITAHVLRRYGYEVLPAANAGEALLLCEMHGRAIDLLVTDVVMPLMSGRALADRLARDRPGLRVLYMSGYTDDAVVHHGVLESGLAYFPKPVRPEALARKVREVLDRPPPGAASGAARGDGAEAPTGRRLRRGG